MNLEIEILKLLSNRYNYNKYIKYIKEHTLTDKTVLILGDYNKLYTDDPDLVQIDFGIYAAYFDVLHGGMKQEKKDLYKKIISNIEHTITSTATEKILEHYITLDGATKAYDQINRLMEGDPSIKLMDIMDTLDETLVQLENQVTARTKEEEDKQEGMIPTDLSIIMGSTVLAKGFEWRLEDLNISIGSLHLGDFVIVFARSELGKTTFITDQTSYMAGQMTSEQSVLFFNNEEVGSAVQSRYFQSTLNKSATEIASNIAKYQAEYIKLLGRGDKIQVLQPDHMDMKYIERKVKEIKPAIVVLNTLDEVHGVNIADNGPTKQKKLYVWARELGVKYNCAVIAVCQADASADGQRYIHYGQMDESKTGKPKTADIIIGIGADHGLPGVRFINISKNKHPSGPRHNPSMSHGRHEVGIDELRGRYISKAYKK